MHGLHAGLHADALQVGDLDLLVDGLDDFLAVDHELVDADAALVAVAAADVAARTGVAQRREIVRAVDDGSWARDRNSVNGIAYLEQGAEGDKWKNDAGPDSRFFEAMVRCAGGTSDATLMSA